MALLTIFAFQGIVTRLYAQTYTVVHHFRGSPADGNGPQAALIGDAAGNLYGTTYYGGASNAGVVFQLNRSGLTVLHSFAGHTDGTNPIASLIRDTAGNLYGTAAAGGTNFAGIAFRLDTSGTETVLFTFGGSPAAEDGAQPVTRLLRDQQGNLYGTTRYGGTSKAGTIFKLDPDGNETVLYSFGGGADAADPYSSLIADAAGNLYGTTVFGGGSACLGAGCGTVFKLSAGGAETVLHSFTGTDGEKPFAGLIRDAAGNLYGTTFYGGAADFGTVFKLDTALVETVLHSFTGGADGAYPQAGVIRDSEGNLYGTASYGGASNAGVVFKLDSAGTETVLHSFAGGVDGAYPQAGVIRDLAGILYGTTTSGGIHDYGVVFKIEP